MFGIFKQNAKISTDEGKIQNLIGRNVEEVFIKDNLLKKLHSGAKLRVKLGFDPTGSKIHIGRAIILRKLKEFQDLGHKVIFIVGDFTARIGDPSDKLEKRPTLSEEQIKENLKNYKEQVGKIINLAGAEFHYNSKWLSKLNLAEVADLSESFSVRQMSERRNFKERFEKGEEVSLKEFLYPLMQGYDSVAVKADVEIGGFDQLFNLKAGRTIQRHFKLPEQDILTTKMLLGTDGRKMSTSWGNVINISDSPSEMFGKIMALKDELIAEYLLLCTETPANEINEIEENIESGKLNPKDAKATLALKIVTIYHSSKEATVARENFFNTFTKGGIPDDALRVRIKEKKFLSDLLLENKIIESKTEFRRLVSDGAIEEIGKGKISDPQHEVSENGRFRIGKHRFLVVIKN